MWSPSGLQVVSEWSPSGLQVVSKWSPVVSSGLQWSPGGLQLIPTLSQVDIGRSVFSGPPSSGLRVFEDYFVHLHTQRLDLRPKRLRRCRLPSLSPPPPTARRRRWIASSAAFASLLLPANVAPIAYSASITLPGEADKQRRRKILRATMFPLVSVSALHGGPSTAVPSCSESPLNINNNVIIIHIHGSNSMVY